MFTYQGTTYYVPERGKHNKKGCLQSVAKVIFVNDFSIDGHVLETLSPCTCEERDFHDWEYYVDSFSLLRSTSGIENCLKLLRKVSPGISTYILKG